MDRAGRRVTGAAAICRYCFAPVDAADGQVRVIRERMTLAEAEADPTIRDKRKVRAVVRACEGGSRWAVEEYQWDGTSFLFDVPRRVPPEFCTPEHQWAFERHLDARVTPKLRAVVDEARDQPWRPAEGQQASLW
jgi:hypothetical protein